MRHVATPFLPEDSKDSKAGCPCEEGASFNCPYCRGSYPFRLAQEQVATTTSTAKKAADTGASTKACANAAKKKEPVG